jgi:hypothetical protein
MTPPRSEAWAICLGAGLAMLWYMARNKFNSAMRVALFTTLGAGFGFAFGNFLQIVGNVLEINFNMWNVMEYNIGFWGGVSMAYGVFSSKWPEVSSVPESWENKVAAALILVFVPFLVFQNSAFYDILLNKSENIQSIESVTYSGSIAAFALFILLVAMSWYVIRKYKKNFDRRMIIQLFVVYFSAYILFSYLVSGAFSGTFRLNHHLYVLNFAVILLFLWKRNPAFFHAPEAALQRENWFMYFILMIFAILLLAFISIHIHGELGGANLRF